MLMRYNWRNSFLYFKIIQESVGYATKAANVFKLGQFIINYLFAHAVTRLEHANFTFKGAMSSRPEVPGD